MNDMNDMNKKNKKITPAIRVIRKVYIVIMLLCAIIPIAMGINDFTSARDDFTTAFVIYNGMSGLLIAFVWSLLIISIVALIKLTPNTDKNDKKSKFQALFFGIAFFAFWLWTFYTFEKPLTLYYVENYINIDGKEYILYDEKNKTASKSQYSKVFLFAKKEIGCEPYDALELRTLDRKKDTRKVQDLNAWYH
ncbi:MAG: hypothetical protein ACTHOO_01675 [Alcanivorax sp.]